MGVREIEKFLEQWRMDAGHFTGNLFRHRRYGSSPDDAPSRS